VKAGYLRAHLKDPINDETYHYRFYRFAAGVEGFTSAFYVVGILNFETTEYAKQPGHWVGTTRDWGDEFAYLIGGESY
jgi:hypothetical protein